MSQITFPIPIHIPTYKLGEPLYKYFLELCDKYIIFEPVPKTNGCICLSYVYNNIFYFQSFYHVTIERLYIEDFFLNYIPKEPIDGKTKLSLLEMAESNDPATNKLVSDIVLNSECIKDINFIKKLLFLSVKKDFVCNTELQFVSKLYQFMGGEWTLAGLLR